MSTRWCRSLSFVVSLASVGLSACGSSDTSPVDASTPPDAAIDAAESIDGAPPPADAGAGECDHTIDQPIPEPAFPGLSAPVEVIRDQNGAPHIFASTDADAYYASGYMQAVDRLFQLDLTRRRALGRRAEVLGDRYYDEDLVIRTVDIPRWGRVNSQDSLRDSPDEWRLFQAWTEGVNARIREVIAAGQLPPEFAELGYMPEEWAVADAFAAGKMILFGNGGQLEFDLLASVIDQYLGDPIELGLLLPIRDSFVMPASERPSSPQISPARAGGPRRPELPAMSAEEIRERLSRFMRTMSGFRVGGSNNWVVGGEHTDTGRPMLSGDPHQPLQSPSLFWLHHINSVDQGGSLDVMGFSFVGTPAVQLGHNRHIAWGATTNYPDHMDIWEVRRVGNDYMVGGQARPFCRRRETILVAGGNTRNIEIFEVPGYGVILPDAILPLPVGSSGTDLLFNWTGFQPTHEGQAFHGFNTAQDIQDWEAAVDAMELGLFNFVAIDQDDISYRSSPLVPDRGAPTADLRPYVLRDGNDPTQLWTGNYLSSSQLPRSRGAGRGWIASANNDPWGFTQDGQFVGDPYYFGAFYDPGLRSGVIEERLAELVASPTPVTVADLQELQDDTHSTIADDLVPALEQAWATVDTDPLLASFRGRTDLSALVAMLSSWDRRMERSAQAPVVFNAFGFYLCNSVIGGRWNTLAAGIGPEVYNAIMAESPAYIFKFLSNVLRGRAPMSDAYFATTPRQLQLLEALDRAATYINDTVVPAHGADYVWADVHGTLFQPLCDDTGTVCDRNDGGWVATDGAEGTVNVSVSRFFAGSALAGNPNARLESTSGSIYRLVASIQADGTPEVYVNAPRGVSGDPASPYWNNLQDDWVENRYRRLPFRRTEVEAMEASRLTLMP